MDICQKDQKPWIGECCCNCGNHHKDFHHPCTTGKECTTQKGWICIIDEKGDGMDLWAHSGWSEHGLCEMWRPKEKKKEKEKKDVNERCAGSQSCKS